MVPRKNKTGTITRLYVASTFHVRAPIHIHTCPIDTFCIRSNFITLLTNERDLYVIHVFLGCYFMMRQKIKLFALFYENLI